MSLSHASKRVARNLSHIVGAAVRSTLESLEERRLFANPVAAPGGPYSVAEGSSVLISGLGSTDSDGTIVTYQWDTNYSAGRGFRARFTGPTWNFTAGDSGTRAIALRVTDNNGDQHTQTGTINISDVAPTISLTAPNNAAEGQSFNVSWSFTDPGASDAVTAWEVDWGDGQTSTLTGSATGSSHTYAEDGAYSIELTATQADATTSVTHNITVDNESPVVSASTTTPSVDEGDTVNLSFSSPNRAGSLDSWVIDWGDGNVDNLPANRSTATHTYTDSGTFNATILALEPDGGSGSAIVAYTVGNVAPGVAITGTPASGDEGTAITVGSTVTDVSTDDTHTYGWTVYRDGSHFVLPGGTTINGTSFTFTPTDDGSYVIRLTVVDDDGASTTVNSSAIAVGNVDPTASVSGEPVGNINEGTAVNLAVTPADAGDEDTFSYAWSVTKDGNAYSVSNNTSSAFSFTPNDNGVYVATVVVTDDDGATVSVNSAAINVDNVNPVAAITGTPVSNPEEGDTVSLGSTVTDAGAADTHTYAWSVTKDGNAYPVTNDTSSTFSFVPTDNGDYVVTLVVTDDDAGTDTVSTATITVDNAAPVSDILGVSTAVEGSSPFLIADVTDAGASDTLTYAWSVEKDGNAFVLPGGHDTTSSSFSFVPTDNGAYVVTLVVTDKDGAQTTRTHNIAVTNVAPTVQQDNVPATGDEGTAITINSTVTDDGADDTLTYGWTVYRDGTQFALPGGTTLNGQSFTFTPTDDGSYVVRLTVVDDDTGSTTVNSSAIVVGNVDPTGVISGEPVGNINEGDAVNLSVTPSDAGSEDTHTYAWSVTKGGNAYAVTNNTSSSFSFTPTDNGTYVATVVVTDDDGGAVSVSTAAITVDNVDPVANISGEPSGNIDESNEVILSAGVTDAGADDSHTYLWTVTKDGNAYPVSNNTSAVFSFSPDDNGTYVATLVVTDDDGGTDTVSTGNIVVDNVAPIGVVTGDSAADEGGAVNYSVAVTDAGSADTHTYAWSVTKDGNAFNLPGGTTTNASSFSFTPTNEGAYVVTVVVTDDDGGANTYTHNLAVSNVAPTPSITGAPASSDEGAAISVGSSITDPGVNDTHTYFWHVTKDGAAYTLPGGTTTNATGFTFTPTDNGAYRVILTATDDFGADTTTFVNITVDNVVPTMSIAGEPVGNINEGVQIDLTTSMTDDGADDTHTWSWTVTKDGQAYVPGVATTTNALSFIPTDNGAYVATATVTDDDGGVTTVSSQSIVVDNVDPVGAITGEPVGNVDEGTAISLGSTVTDDGSADTHTYAWSVTKDGNAYSVSNNTSSTFNFTPNDNGDYVVTLVVTDDDGGTDTITSSTITVDNVAPAPTISGNSSVNEAASITLTAAANDVSTADTHTYSWSVTKDGNAYNLPGGTVTNASSFTFTPSSHGAYVVSCVVTDDDGGSNTATHNLTVNNLPPVVNITGLPSGTRAEGYVFNVAATATDPGGDTNFTYAWSVTKNGSPFTLPGGTVTNAQTFTFETADNGLYRITAAVTDSGGATGTSTTSNLTITNALPNGTINNAPTSSPENTPITVDITADDPGSDDTLSYLWSVTKNGNAFTLPGGTVVDTTSFTFIPTDDGTYVVSCRVTDDDGGITTVSAAGITVTNENPIADITGEPTQSILEGLLVQLASGVMDAGPLDTFTYAWSVTKDGNAYAVTNNTSSTFNFTPTDNGTYVATLTVTDDDGGSHTVTSDAIVVTNAAPTGSISAPTSAVEGATVSASTSITDAGSADTHTYAWSVTKDGNAYSVSNTTASTFSFVPDDNGAYILTCVVTDDDGGAVTLASNLTVTNAAPTASISGPSTGNEGTQIDLTSTIADAGSADTHTYAWTVTRGVTTITTGTGSTLSFTPDDEGTYSVSLVVTDDDGASVTATHSIAVANVNPTASITGAPVGTVDEGTAISLGSTAADVGTTDTLSYAWSVSKDGSAYSVTGNTSSTFSFTPTDNGSYVVTLVVSDNDGGSVSVSTAAITVGNVAPTVGIATQAASGIEGTPMSFSFTRTDPGSADTFDHAWSVTRDGQAYLAGVVSDGSILDFSFTPTDNGDYVITFVATDDDGGSDTISTSPITVSNATPTGSIAGDSTANEGSEVTLTATPADAGEEDTFTYAWSVTKDGNAYDLGSATVDAASLTFIPADNGAYVATCVVTDDDGDAVTLTHNLAVSNVDPTVGIIDVPPSGAEGATISVNSLVSDPGDDSLTYGWTVRRDGVVVVLPQGIATDLAGLSFTPTDNGNYQIRLTVLDDDGGSTTTNSSVFTVSNVIPAAAITGVPANANEGEEISLSSSTSDAGVDDETAGFTYAWTVTRGEEVIATGDEADFAFTPDVHGAYSVVLAVTDKDGATTTTSATTITVDNVAPTNAVIGEIPESMDEGDVALLAGSASDASGDDLTYHWSVTRNGSAFGEADGQIFEFSPHARGEYEITLVATDTAGATTSTTESITVDNVAPTGTFTGPTSALLLGETATFGLSIEDIPSSQALSVTWDFGDGQTASANYTGDQSGLSKTHTYAADGVYTVSITIDDGVDSTVLTRTVNVSRAGVRTDLLDSTKTSLFVLGTSSNDSITVEPSTTAGRWKVTLNGVVLGDQYLPTARTIIYGNAGSNIITVNGGLSAMVYAGTLNSSVTTGSGNDIIFGTPGADALNGGAGRDIVIGNAGKDTITGGESEDVVVANVVNWSSNYPAIKIAMDTWAGSSAFAARVTSMKATGLFSGTKLVADADQDQMYGNERSDWFVVDSASDRIRDWQSAFDLAN